MINATQAADKERLVKQYLAESKGKSLRDARAVAKAVLGPAGPEVHFDWDAPRTREGYYRLKGGCDCAIMGRWYMPPMPIPIPMPIPDAYEGMVARCMFAICSTPPAPGPPAPAGLPWRWLWWRWNWSCQPVATGCWCCC